MQHDAVIQQIDIALRTLFSVGTPSRPSPAEAVLATESSVFSSLNATETAQSAAHTTAHSAAHSAGLMRVNHVGEVCAQALYAGAALTTKNAAIKQFHQRAAIEEYDHLLWTAQRLKALNSRTSLLNPLWYVASFGMGAAAGLLGDKTSLSFVRETEAQVEAHLHNHEIELPASDTASRAIVAQMKIDEAAHGEHATLLGGVSLPNGVKQAMKLTAKVMTKTAYYV